MTISAVPPTRRRRHAWLVVVLVLLLGLGAAAGWFFFLRSVAFAIGPTVNIIEPASGTAAEFKAQVLIRGSAEFPQGVTRLELYDNGALVAVRGSTLPGGSDPLLMAHPWQPDSVGRHALMVRAYTGDGGFSDSRILFMDVVALLVPNYSVNVDDLAGSERPSLDDLARSAGVNLDEVVAINPGFERLDPGEPLPRGTTVLIPRRPATVAAGGAPDETGGSPAGSGGSEGAGDSGESDGISESPDGEVLPAEPAPGTPAPPTDLAATLDCGTAQLTWSDSPAETSYIVYRIVPGSTTLLPIATVPANTTSFSDTLVGPGEYRYQVAAARDGLQGLSLMAIATTPDCSGAPPGDLVVSITGIETDEIFDGIYCYFSIDGSGYERVPSGDFAVFSPISGNPRFYDLRMQLPAHGQYVLIGHGESAPIPLAAECIGRRGIETINLGALERSAGPEEWDNRDLEAQTRPTVVRMAASAASPPASSHRFRLFYRIGRNSPDDRLAGLDPPRRADLTLPPLGIPAELIMPYSGPSPSIPSPAALRFATEQSNASLCGDAILVGENGEPLVAESCPRGQARVLQWSWGGSTAVPQAEAFRVEMTLTDLNTGVERPLAQQEIRPGSRRSMALPTTGLPCGARISYRVIAMVGALESFASDPLSEHTERCVSSALVYVTFESLHIGPSRSSGEVVDNNGDFCLACTDRRLEYKGWIGVNEVGYRTAHDPGLLSDSGRLLSGCPEEVLCLGEGDHQWSLQWLRAGSSAQAAAGQGSTTLVVDRNNRSLTIWVALSEVDDGGRITPFGEGCVASLELAPRSPDEWAGYSERLTLSGGDSQAACEITVEVRGEAQP